VARRYYSSSAADTTLGSSITAGATSITVGSVTGHPVQYPYTLILDPETPSEEVVTVTAGTGTTLTVSRGQDGTTALAHTTGAVVRHGVSARDYDEPNAHIQATTNVHGATGAVMGTTNTQVVTNKDMTDPSNTFPVANTLPAGMIAPYAGAAAPTGWLLADGSAVSRTTYAALYAALGGASSPYGQGNGTTTFNLPNLKGRIPVGIDGAQTEFDTRAETGGAKTHTLSTAELPGHTHAVDHDHGSVNSGNQNANHQHGASTDSQGSHAHGVELRDKAVAGGGLGSYEYGFGTYAVGTNAAGAHGHNVSVGSENANHQHSVDLPAFTGTSGSTGSGSAHNNLQPYIALHYIIKH
jgi:microcystin-dependent protein